MSWKRVCTKVGREKLVLEIKPWKRERLTMMKKQMRMGAVKLGMLCAGFLVVAEARATTTVTMTLSGEPYSEYSSAFDAYLGSQKIINPNGLDWIGIYSFN